MIHVALPTETVLAGLTGIGIIAGLVLLIRSFDSYRTAPTGRRPC